MYWLSTMHGTNDIKIQTFLKSGKNTGQFTRRYQYVLLLPEILNTNTSALFE